MEFNVEDPLGRRIRLTKRQFADHIEPNHLEMKGKPERLKQVIEDPDLIERHDGNRRCFYRKHGRMILARVAVQLDKKNSMRGHVITGFECFKIKEGGVIEWQKRGRNLSQFR